MKLEVRPESKKAEEPEIYHQKYDEFKKQGHSFWPEIIFEDTIAVILVLVAIIALTVLKSTPLGELADPTDRSYVPRPEWYFMFLFQLLRYFPGSLEWVGVALVPGLAVLFLLFLPLLDRHPRRSLGRRPWVMALAVVMVAGVFFLTYKAYETTPATAAEAAGEVRLTSIQQMGRNIFRAQCTSCHTVGGAGAKGGLPLEGIGSRLTAEQIHNYIENPQRVNPKATMPGFEKSLTHPEVEAISRYLSIFTTSGGTR